MRRDRYRCPFHGIIISRDEHGQPLEDSAPSTSSTQNTYSTNTFGDKGFLKDVSSWQTGKQLSVGKRKRKTDFEGSGTSLDGETSARTTSEENFQ